jgi:hypothetical protein
MTEEPSRPIPASYWVIPGSLLAGEYPGSFDPQTARDRIEAFLQAGIDTFIDMTTPGELVPYEPLLKEQAPKYKLEVSYFRFPIRDRGLPAPGTMEKILATLDQALAAGRKVYVHCWGGVGRTGMVVGCHLVHRGLAGEQALARLADWWRQSPKREAYPRSPETDEQVQFILDWRG